MGPHPPSRIAPRARAPGGLAATVRRALAEDRVRHDRTTRALLPSAVPARARVVAQANGVLSGLRVAVEVARQLGVRARPLARDGDRVAPGSPVLHLEGDARAILAAERTLLNFLMHLSGVATATARAVRRAHGGGAALSVYATRKTLPGLRDLEKAAVVDGGGAPHRRDLSDALLLKNNHLALVPLPEAVRRVRRRVGPRAPIEVEVRDARAALSALRAGATALLIDNASPARVRRILRRIEETGRRASLWVEVSGGITPDTVVRYRSTGADAASLGSLTHSARALPFHLLLAPVRRRRVRPPSG